MHASMEAPIERTLHDGATYQNPRDGNVHWGSGQTIRTALVPNSSLGWALITHPFHPLSGQRFPILKIRKIGGEDVLNLYAEARGSLSIPPDAADQALLRPYAGLVLPPPILDLQCMPHHLELVRAVTSRTH